MYNLDVVIDMIEKRNNIKIQRDKFEPIYEEMTYCKKEKNQILTHIGDINKNLYIILSGTVRLYYIDSEGNDITRFFETQGCVGGGYDECMPFVVETLDTCEFLTIDSEKVKNMTGDDIYWLKIINQYLQNCIRYKIYRESSFLTESATERYIDFKRMYPKLEERVNQSCIASYLGITPVSLSRIRRTIKEEK